MENLFWLVVSNEKPPLMEIFNDQEDHRDEQCFLLIFLQQIFDIIERKMNNSDVKTAIILSKSFIENERFSCGEPRQNIVLISKI